MQPVTLFSLSKGVTESVPRLARRRCFWFSPAYLWDNEATLAFELAAAPAFLRRRQAPQRSPMKPLKLALTPTRNRRLNEVTGMVLMVAASLLFLALASYRPTDPSFNTVGAMGQAPLHNWIGLLGASLSDVLLQLEGVAAFLIPVDAGGSRGGLRACVSAGGFPGGESIRRFSLSGICTRHLRPHPLVICTRCTPSQWKA